MPRKQGSIGKPVPGQEVKIIDTKGEFINEPGIDGEIVVRYNTPVAFLRYWENEKETQKKIVNGWLFTGDFAFKDDEGYFYFKGREDDIIRGNIIKAFVVPRDKKNVSTQNSKLKKVIQNDVKSKLAYHEYPRVIEFVDELPMTTTGKIIRKDLRKTD